jgi:hypothetical protein
MARVFARMDDRQCWIVIEGTDISVTNAQSFRDFDFHKALYGRGVA